MEELSNNFDSVCSSHFISPVNQEVGVNAEPVSDSLTWIKWWMFFAAHSEWTEKGAFTPARKGLFEWAVYKEHKSSQAVEEKGNEDGLHVASYWNNHYGLGAPLIHHVRIGNTLGIRITQCRSNIIFSWFRKGKAGEQQLLSGPSKPWRINKRVKLDSSHHPYSFHLSNSFFSFSRWFISS